MSQPTFNDMVNLFKQNDYIEIGYLDGIKRVYLSKVNPFFLFFHHLFCKIKILSLCK